MTWAACWVSAWCWRWASSMACWICTFGSAYSSTFELNSAMRYFHALTNGLAMGTFPPSGLSRLRFYLVPTYRFITRSGHRHGHNLRNDDLGGGVDTGDTALI